MYCNDGAVTQEATTDMVKRGLSVDVVKDGATLLDQIKQCELVRRRNWETQSRASRSVSRHLGTGMAVGK